MRDSAAFLLDVLVVSWKIATYTLGHAAKNAGHQSKCRASNIILP